MLWVLLDEDIKDLNDAAFCSGMESPVWYDVPGTYHDFGCGFAFADGHSEIHKWRDPRTTPVLKPGQDLTLNQPLPNNQDVFWMQDHSTRLK